MQSSEAAEIENRENNAARILHPGFVLTGVVSNLLGAMLPIFTARWLLTDALAGYMFVAQYAGVLTGNAVTNRAGARLGLLRLLAIGYFIMAAGVAGFGASGWLMTEISTFVFGVALGLTIPPINLLIADISPGRSAAALNVLNVSWCVGAVICSPLAVLFARANILILPHAVLVAGLSAIGFYLTKQASLAPVPAAMPDPTPGDKKVFWGNPVAMTIGALMFLYVGTETAIGGWVASYTKRATSASPAAWALAQSAFWATLMAGRALAPLLLRKIASAQLVLVGLVGAGCGIAILLGNMGMAGHWAGIVVTGAGMAAVFPTTIAIFSGYFGARASNSLGLIFAFGGLGGAGIPWLVGLASSQSGSLRTGLFATLFAVPLMIAIQIRLIRLLPKPA